MKIGNWKLENSNRGFTLVEVLVVVAITITIAVAGFLGLAGYRNKQALESGLNEVRAAVEATKRRSVVQEQGSRWGMRLTNATSGISSYAVFKGSSYSTSGLDRTYSFRAPVGFGNPSASSTYDVVFTPLSGALSENKVLTLAGGSRGFIGDLILRTIGSITARTDNGVVGYWHFDEGTGTLAYDASGRGNTGTLTNGPTWQSGSSCKAGSCLSFDGVNDYVDLSSLPSQSFTTDASIIMWLKATTNDDWKRSPIYFGSYDDWYGSISVYLSVFRVGRINFTNGEVVKNVWHQLAITTTPGTNGYKIYQNGVLKYTTDGENNVNLTYKTLGGGVLGYWSGSIDEVRVYNRALSASEIATLYSDLE